MGSHVGGHRSGGVGVVIASWNISGHHGKAMENHLDFDFPYVLSSMLCSVRGSLREECNLHNWAEKPLKRQHISAFEPRIKQPISHQIPFTMIYRQFSVNYYQLHSLTSVIIVFQLLSIFDAEADHMIKMMNGGLPFYSLSLFNEKSPSIDYLIDQPLEQLSPLNQLYHG